MGRRAKKAPVSNDDALRWRANRFSCILEISIRQAIRSLPMIMSCPRSLLSALLPVNSNSVSLPLLN